MRALLALPNLLTLVRLPLAVIIWIAPAHAVFFFTVMTLAGLSDVLDGWFARRIRARRKAMGANRERLEETAQAGAWLDPFCDKIFFTSALIAVGVRTHAPLWIALLIGAREVLYTPFVLAYHSSARLRERIHYDFTAGILGKVTTNAQFLALAAVVLQLDAMLPLAILAASFGLATGLFYLWRAWRMAHMEPPHAE